MTTTPRTQQRRVATDVLSGYALPSEEQIRQFFAAKDLGKKWMRHMERYETVPKAARVHMPCDFRGEIDWDVEPALAGIYYIDDVSVEIDPVTGLTYGYPLERTEALVVRARALKAKERYPWLPLNYEDREALKYGNHERNLLDVMRGHFARSLGYWYDLDAHPDWLTYAAAYLANQKALGEQAHPTRRGALRDDVTDVVEAVATVLGIRLQPDPRLPRGRSEWDVRAH